MASASSKRHANGCADCTKPKVTKTHTYQYHGNIEGIVLDDLTWTEEDEVSLQQALQSKPAGLIPIAHHDFVGSDNTPNSSPIYNNTTIGRLSTIRASLWNAYAETVYYAFNIKSYISHPNHILRASTAQPNALHHGSLDFYLNKVRPKEDPFPAWFRVEKQLHQILPLFEGCDKLPHQLKDVHEATSSVNRFLFNLSNVHLSIQEEGSPWEDVVSSLTSFGESFRTLIKNGKSPEDTFEGYFHTLALFFSAATRQNFRIEQKRKIGLDLRTANKSDGQEMTVIPDFLLLKKRWMFLVGQTKKFGVVSANVEGTKGALVTDPLELCRQTGHDKQRLNTDEVSDADEAAASDIQPTSESNCPSKLYFRKLSVKEKHKISYMLPQLFAEMLAALETNRMEGVQFKSYDGNESVQMGFFLDGLKLRFVRLVLRQGNSSIPPTLADIRNRNVRSEVFLTGEMNLFNPAHIMLFFQILHSILNARKF